MTYVVDHDEKGRPEAGAEKGARPNSPVEKDARRNRRALLQPGLNGEESNHQDAKDDKQGNDAAILPGVLGSTPLQRQQETDDGRNEHGCAEQVKRQDLLLQRQMLLGERRLGQLQKQDDEGDSDGPKRQVDVEAPAPADVVGEGSAHEGPGNRGNAVHGAYHTHVYGPLTQRNTPLDNEESAGEDAGGAEAGYGAAEDQADRVGRRTAHQRADFEEQDGEEVDPFDRVKGVELAKDELHGARGEEVGGAVPAHVLDGVELVCYSGDRRRDDCVVLEHVRDMQLALLVLWQKGARTYEGHAEHRKAKRHGDEDEPPGRGVVVVVILRCSRVGGGWFLAGRESLCLRRCWPWVVFRVAAACRCDCCGAGAAGDHGRGTGKAAGAIDLCSWSNWR